VERRPQAAFAENDNETGRHGGERRADVPVWRVSRWIPCLRDVTFEDVMLEELTFLTFCQSLNGHGPSRATLRRWQIQMGSHALQVLALLAPTLLVLTLWFLLLWDPCRLALTGATLVFLLLLWWKVSRFVSVLPLVTIALCAIVAHEDIKQGGTGFLSSCNTIFFTFYALRFPTWIGVVSLAASQALVTIKTPDRPMPPCAELVGVCVFFFFAQGTRRVGGVASMYRNLLRHWLATAALLNDCEDERDAQMAGSMAAFVAVRYATTDGTGDPAASLRLQDAMLLCCGWFVAYSCCRWWLRWPIPRFLPQLARAHLALSLSRASTAYSSLENEAMVIGTSHTLIVFGGLNPFIVTPIALWKARALFVAGAWNGGLPSAVYTFAALMSCAATAEPYVPGTKARRIRDFVGRKALQARDLAVRAKDAYVEALCATPRVVRTAEGEFRFCADEAEAAAAMAAANGERPLDPPPHAEAWYVYLKLKVRAGQADAAETRELHSWETYSDAASEAQRRLREAHVRSWFAFLLPAISLCILVELTLQPREKHSHFRLFVGIFILVVSLFGLAFARLCPRFCTRASIALVVGLATLHACLDLRTNNSTRVMAPALHGVYGMVAFHMSFLETSAALALAWCVASCCAEDSAEDRAEEVGFQLRAGHVVVFAIYAFLDRARYRMLPGGALGIWRDVRPSFERILDVTAVPPGGHSFSVAIALCWRLARFFLLGYGSPRMLTITAAWISLGKLDAYLLAREGTPGDRSRLFTLPRCAVWAVDTVLAFGTIALPPDCCERERIAVNAITGVLLVFLRGVQPWYAATGLAVSAAHQSLPRAPTLIAIMITVVCGREGAYMQPRLDRWGMIARRILSAGCYWPEGLNLNQDVGTNAVAAIVVGMALSAQATSLGVIGSFGGCLLLSSRAYVGRTRFLFALLMALVIGYRFGDILMACVWFAASRLLAEYRHYTWPTAFDDRPVAAG